MLHCFAPLNFCNIILRTQELVGAFLIGDKSNISHGVE